MEWYYQIKSKSQEGSSNKWSFPPIFSGKVSARDKKEAFEIITDEYDAIFKRDLVMDLSDREFLLRISELDQQTSRLFIYQECKQCGGPFKVINHYNNLHQQYKGFDYCSDECKSSAFEFKRYSQDYSEKSGSAQPVIYCLVNARSGLRYFGKTTQPFTLRWYQHFFQQKDTKLGKAIRESKINEWVFQVVEVIEIPDYIKNKDQAERYILWKEAGYIHMYNTVNNGYNSSQLKDYEIFFEDFEAKFTPKEIYYDTNMV